MKRPKDVRTIKALLEAAEDEARRAGEPQPGAEHLLLAALDLPGDDSARALLRRAGADPDGLRDAIEAQHADALRAIGLDLPDALAGPSTAAPPKRPRLFRAAPSVQQLLKAIHAETKLDDLAGAHVVAAVARMEHGTAARALDALGADRAVLRDAS